MNDDDKRSWDNDDPFDRFSSFEDFLEHFQDFMNTPFARMLMKQIFEMFQQLSKARNFPSSSPKKFDLSQFLKKFNEQMNSDVRINLPFRPSLNENQEEQFEPASSVYEVGRYIRVVVDLPGMERDQIEVDVQKDQVDIRAQNDGRNVHKLIELHSKVNPKNVISSWNNGVLELTLEKL